MKKVFILFVILCVFGVLPAGCRRVEDNPQTSYEQIEDNTQTSNEQIEDNPMAEIKAAEIVAQMKVGWNLGNTFDSTNDKIIKADRPYKWETAWGNPKTTEKLIQTVIDKGFNVIRIPVSWKNHIVDENNYKILDSWMDRVQEVVDYAYSNGAYVILNTHHEDWYEPYYDNLDAAGEKMEAVWIQIADRFKDYDEHLIFEGMNEPRKIGVDNEWTGDNEGFAVVNKLNRIFVETIRNAPGNNPYRILMVTGYAANGWDGLKKLEVMEDDKLIISVHAYEPYNFALNTEGTNLWNEDKTNINIIMENIRTKYLLKGVPVIIGEFGAMNKENESERVDWVKYYMGKARALSVPCLWWDNGVFEGSGERFGLINRTTYEWQYPRLVDAIIEVSGEQAH